MKHAFVSFVLFLVLPMSGASADQIVANFSDLNPRNLTGPFGQSLTTPSGMPWNNLTFSWINGVGSNDPTAAGTLYLLTQEYLGAPGSLSDNTAGLLASAPASGSQYVFDSSVIVQPNTKYWFYTDEEVSIRVLSSDVGLGGNVYSLNVGDGINYAPRPGRDAKFVLNGSAIPEPNSFLLLAGTAMLGLSCRRRR